VHIEKLYSNLYKNNRTYLDIVYKETLEDIRSDNLDELSVIKCGLSFRHNMKEYEKEIHELIKR